MEGISDIRIVGLDERRPPKIIKSPYIDLYFKLSHKAPADWCNQFNDLLTKQSYRPNIDPDEGLFIKTWVRKAHEIPGILELLKKNVSLCTENYIARIEAASRRGPDPRSAVSPEQAELNAIIDALEFDEPVTG
ncbi:MAG: hypothetical protein R3200_04905 [Xanthomonadales bacterium]|nr:hypothetical protein [Xanthomonadales bacterium]